MAPGPRLTDRLGLTAPPPGDIGLCLYTRS
jgi:hypothetical protein